MKGIIVYKGKYGATRQYAEWVASELQFPVFTPEYMPPQQLEKCELIIAGGSVYEGRWMMRKWLANHEHALKNKKLILFIVCGTLPNDGESLDKIARENIPAHLRNIIPVYFLHGRMLLKQLSWTDKAMLRIGASMMRDPVKKKEMLQDFDDVKKEHLTPLLQAARGQGVYHWED